MPFSRSASERWWEAAFLFCRALPPPWPDRASSLRSSWLASWCSRLLSVSLKWPPRCLTPVEPTSTSTAPWAPLMGTIAGFGVWFSLVFKSAFALDGLSEYLKLGFENAPVKTIALALGVVLILVNIYGVRFSGRLQAVVVSTVMISLAVLVFTGLGDLEGARFEPFLPEGYGGLLAATGIVFVAYAGVTNVASVAEEVRRPARNIPRGILTSLGIMIFLYPAIATVIVGVTAGSTSTRTRPQLRRRPRPSQVLARNSPSASLPC